MGNFDIIMFYKRSIYKSNLQNVISFFALIHITNYRDSLKK